MPANSYKAALTFAVISLGSLCVIITISFLFLFLSPSPFVHRLFHLSVFPPLSHLVHAYVSVLVILFPSPGRILQLQDEATRAVVVTLWSNIVQCYLCKS